MNFNQNIYAMFLHKTQKAINISSIISLIFIKLFYILFIISDILIRIQNCYSLFIFSILINFGLIFLSFILIFIFISYNHLYDDSYIILIFVISSLSYVNSLPSPFIRLMILIIFISLVLTLLLLILTFSFNDSFHPIFIIFLELIILSCLLKT